mmetsp:Transcript_91216/g.263181  ORF Transcript_91216/g.263181 Transcript_91216/m.263181 type:complete len:201 (+) Transcript_91216:470-1072(+)
MGVKLVVRVQGPGQGLLEEFLLRQLQLLAGRGQRADGRQRLHTPMHQLLEAADAEHALTLGHDPAGVVVVLVVLGARGGLRDEQPGLQRPDLRLQGVPLLRKALLHLLHFLFPPLDLCLMLALALLLLPPSRLHLLEGAPNLLLEEAKLLRQLGVLLQQPVALLAELLALLLGLLRPIRHRFQLVVRPLELLLASLQRVL